MSTDQKALETLIAKEDIRQLAMLYSRGVDREDAALLRTLYTKDGMDTHGNSFKGTAADFVTYLENAFSRGHYRGHHICNHLISVDGDQGEGEVYAIAYHVNPDGKGGWHEDIMLVRYLDHYRKEDGRWRFAERLVTYDMRTIHPISSPVGDKPNPLTDPSVTTLASRIFARGARA